MAHHNAPVTNGDEVIMEIDLRSTQPEKRTLRFFVNNKSQRMGINYLPSSVVFAV